MSSADYDLIASAIRRLVEKFSDRRLNDGDDVWRERELEYRRGVAETANEIFVELSKKNPMIRASRFAEACGLHVSAGRDNYGDCRPGEITWEAP